MLLKTSKFGEVEVNEDLIFDFIEPILGYEELKKFALIEHSDNSPFKWLQALDNPDISLPVTLPAFFELKYEFTIPDEKVDVLEVATPDDILALNIVHIPVGKPQDSEINLLAPIVINVTNKKAIQLILANTNFSVRHRLFDENDKKETNTK